MTKPQVAEYNIETGQSIVRDMTDDEIAQHEIDLANSQAMIAKMDARDAAKVSAIAKLEALGLTEDEAKAILG